MEYFQYIITIFSKKNSTWFFQNPVRFFLLNIILIYWGCSFSHMCIIWQFARIFCHIYSFSNVCTWGFHCIMNNLQCFKTELCLDQNARFALYGTSFNNFRTSAYNRPKPSTTVSVGMSNHYLKLFFSPWRAEAVFALHNPAKINKQNAFM